MADRPIRRALIAVYDKSGIVEFARALVDEFGIEIISTGGTAKHLKEHGIPVTLVEEITGFPEMLDGRVKTLHPKIHAAILADRDNPEHMRQLEQHGIQPIDMVVVNLYPFEKTVANQNCTFEQAIEMIDIGGPCMLRAAAKNHKHVLVVPGAYWYERSLELLRCKTSDPPEIVRIRLGAGVFSQTQAYDAGIMNYLIPRSFDEVISKSTPESLTTNLILSWQKYFPFRYGENPHQAAAYYRPNESATTFHSIDSESKQSTSYNNALDFDAALALCAELTREASPLWHRLSAGATKNDQPPHRLMAGATRMVVARVKQPLPSIALFIKHTNACGVGIADDPIDAYRKAYLGDPNAAMGGILAVNFPVTAAFAEVVMDSLQRWGKDAGAGAFFVEVWVAPSFDKDAVEVIRTKKKWGEKVRLLAVGPMDVEPDPNELDYKRIAGGMLVQTRNLVGLNEEQWKVVTKRAPTESEMSDLRLAWLIAKHTKSNAISIVKDGMLIGNGAGQMSRVMSCRIATWLAKENGHANRLAGSVAASDAFFPFRDGPDILMEAGVAAIIQPGGSKRDDETIAACDERGVAMIFTGTRHFKH
ncbi:MAG: bifunctional phosphoribosylaminoimidazolecarboxamide formyltransferase/inosine monophosphate cyclohydrolase [Planctomycetota bacterium]|nr:MAG: bifunctional phosphoribosylaminoimidazolecarboxamide formyltransferase/inosine monophosphate cyclohydrolase [Planctomycetota bacterium]